MSYNPKIHHRRSIRIQGYDYSQEGLYFITICTHNRECLFGNVGVVGVKNLEPLQPQPSTMILNDAGHVANECWLKIPEHFPKVVLHEHIVMPNHVHGIIEIVRVEDFQPLHDIRKRNEFQKIIPRSVGSIVRGYKIGVTKWFRSNVGVQNVGVQDFEPLPQPIWQRNYHEHIIRNEKSYQIISDYILHNPEKWEQDKKIHCRGRKFSTPTVYFFNFKPILTF